MFNKSIDHENGLICFLFIMCTIFWETSMEMDVVTLNVIVKNKSTTIFHGLTLIDHRHDLKMFKHFAVKPLACGSWFYLSFEHVDITSMVDKSTDHMLMIYEITHIWPAEMKWRWRNDRRSESNLCNCVKKPEKKIQDFNGVWTCDFAITGVMLYQLSYEATDVGSRSTVGSYVPVKEMIVNDIWNKSYMNCGNEMKMKKWSSQWTHRKLLLICCLDTNPYCSTPFHFQTKKNNIFSCC